MRSQPAEPADAPEVRLLLICQAEGLRNRYSGLAGYEEADDNSGLTAVGWEQTNLLAAWLKSHEKIDVLVSGPQLRSRLTAQRVGQVLGLPVKVRLDLPKYAAEKLRGPGSNGEMPRMLSALAQVTPEEGSEYRHFCEATVGVVDQVLQEHWGATIAIVLTGQAVAAITRQFFGAQRLPIAVAHSGITEFSRRGGKWRLAYVNRREHLPVPALPPNAIAAAASVPGQSGIDPDELAQIVDVYNRLAARSGAEQPNAERLQRMRDFLRFARLPADARVLDAGTGVGTFALLLVEEGEREVVGVDVSPVTLETAEYQRLMRESAAAARVSFRLAPAQALPFSDEWFDAVVCRLLLYHTTKPERILQETLRVLKTGGVFVLCDLLGADDPVKRATQNAIEARRNPAFNVARTQEQYRKLLTAAGLTIESERVAVFEREVEEWLSDMDADPASRTVVRDMMEAGIETDASGFHVRRQGAKLLFEQRMIYIRALKKGA